MIKNKIIYTDYCNWKFDLKRAKGSYIWDQKGNKLIDFTSGWNVINLGWNHLEITQAVIEQLKKNTYAPMWTADPVQNKYADLLTKSLSEGLDSIGRVTGGMEANEEAIKLARSYTGRKKILGFIESYHGQGLNCMAISNLPEWVAKITDKRNDLLQIPFPNTYRTKRSNKELLSQLELRLEKLLVKKDIAALLTESGVITGWGSTYIAPDGFLTLIRKVTKKHGTLLILDEVGSAFSRLGKLFAMEIENVVPDIVTLAKGISNGVAPIGVMVTTNEIAKKGYAAANLQSTFGWMPVACAAALKTLQIHIRDKVWLKAEKDGNYLLKALKKELKNHPKVGDIRGKGMEIGIDFVKNKKTKEKDPEIIEKIVEKAFSRGLHIVCDHDSNIQLMPPLIISRKDLNKGLDILVKTINQFN
ncbi:aspartate aminotransferase family protein [Candidatus Microgenomates bacterium]|nr:aspartate aminotransferase family protein [Candidatus Microgenomates bacterium]